MVKDLSHKQTVLFYGPYRMSLRNSSEDEDVSKWHFIGKWRSPLYILKYLEMVLTDPDSYNWLFHQKLILSNSNFLPKLDKVDKSFYAEYSNGIINRQNGKIAESLSCFRSLLKKAWTSRPLFKSIFLYLTHQGP